MNIPFSGGCACGAIRYDCSAQPLAMLNCHCRDCQRSTGGPFSAGVVVPAAAFKVLRGELRYYASPGALGGESHRGFCSNCGSPIAAWSDSAPQFVGIKVSSLDDPSWFKPQFDMF